MADYGMNRDYNTENKPAPEIELHHHPTPQPAKATIGDATGRLQDIIGDVEDRVNWLASRILPFLKPEEDAPGPRDPGSDKFPYESDQQYNLRQAGLRLIDIRNTIQELGERVDF